MFVYYFRLISSDFGKLFGGVCFQWLLMRFGFVGCVLLRYVLGQWLEQDTPLNPMEKNYVRFEAGKLTMKEQRILSTFIFAEAWEQFTAPKFQHCRLMAWVHSGAAVTTTGKNDWAIQSPGFLGVVEIPSEHIPK